MHPSYISFGCRFKLINDVTYSYNRLLGINEGMVMKVVIWGAGRACEAFILTYKWFYEKVLYWDVKGIVDSSKNKIGKKFMGIEVSSIEEIDLNLDLLFIAMKDSDFVKEVVKTAVSNGISRDKILLFDDFYSLRDRYLIEKLSLRYKDDENQEIRDTICFMQENGITVFNQWIQQKDSYDEVYWDSINAMPYIEVMDKRLYYPQCSKFIQIDGKKYVKNLLWEQTKGSPHEYCLDNHTVNFGDVIVDAGVCEGNFSIRFIEDVKKVYLIECDSIWKKPLEETFKPFKDKTIFCNKFVSRYDSPSSIKLDSLVNEHIDFIKADIEGAEVDMLIGAERILKDKEVKISICTYHKKDDERYVRWILEGYGFQCEKSNGNMLFLYDEALYMDPELRNGIIYGRK